MLAAREVALCESQVVREVIYNQDAGQ